jgi:hypothetical protein
MRRRFSVRSSGAGAILGPRGIYHRRRLSLELRGIALPLLARGRCEHWSESSAGVFYPRMMPGGIILTHDYSYLNGVRAAFTEFLATRRERAIELPTSQAILIKL